MPGRQTVPIPFGPGLERERGIMAVRRGSMEDLRNVLFRRGKLVLRKGHEATLTFTDEKGAAVTHILNGQMLLGERTGVVVTYQGNDADPDTYGDVDVHLLDGNASDQRRLGTWFNTEDIGLDPAEVPIISMADTYNRCFMAHDEFRIKARAPTVYYDPFEGPGLQTLRADLANNTEDDETDPAIKFRGVEDYLSYLVGWGFGTSQDDRAELVRVSLPADPTTFRPEHYFIAGARNDPTIACKPAGNVLAVFKEAESYRITGYSRDTFGIEPLDSRHGCIAPRLATEVGDHCYFWSQDGPRVTDGNRTQDISENLELDGFEPSGLVAAGETVQGWAGYINSEDVVLFAFNRRIYVLSLHNRDQPRWSYWTLPFDQFCGFQLYSTGVGDPEVAAPTGHPEFNQDLAAPEEYQIHPEWDNVGQDGDEKVEIWYRRIENILTGWRMDADADADGVVDEFTENSDAAVTATFSFDDTLDEAPAQAIEITGSTGAGHAWIQRVEEEVSPGNVYDIHVETWLQNVVGSFAGTVHGRWLDAGDAELGTFTIGPFTGPTAEFERRFNREVTAPASTAKLEIRFRATAQASGDTGKVWYRLAVVTDRASYPAKWQVKAVPVSVTSPQEQIIGTDDEKLARNSTFEVGLRYRRAGIFYTAGYETKNPETWPDESLGLGTTLFAVAELDFQHWFYGEHTSGATGHGLAFKIQYAEGVKQDMQDAQNDGKSVGIEVYRKRPGSVHSGDPDNTEFRLHDTVSGIPEDDWYVDNNLGEDTSSENEEDYEYKIRVFIGQQKSEFSAVVTRWPGPFYGPTQLQAAEDSDTPGDVNLSWINDDDAEHQGFKQWCQNEQDVRDATGTAHGFNVNTLEERRDVDAGGSFSQVETIPCTDNQDSDSLSAGTTYEFRMRHDLEIGAGDVFYSPYSNVAQESTA